MVVSATCPPLCLYEALRQGLCGGGVRGCFASPRLLPLPLVCAALPRIRAEKEYAWRTIAIQTCHWGADRLRRIISGKHDTREIRRQRQRPWHMPGPCGEGGEIGCQSGPTRLVSAMLCKKATGGLRCWQ